MCTDYITYGRREYDFQENTLVFMAPGQVFGHPQDGSTYKAKGGCLYFSPELLRGTSLGLHMKDWCIPISRWLKLPTISGINILSISVARSNGL